MEEKNKNITCGHVFCHFFQCGGTVNTRGDFLILCCVKKELEQIYLQVIMNSLNCCC